MVDRPPRATLTIRIEPDLHRSLAAIADAGGVSMNAVAEAALNREVVLRAAELAETYERAADAMRGHSRRRLADLVDEIATDEAATPEPLATTRAPAVGAATFEAIAVRAHRVG
jgi:predicted transcriptional regulator